MTRHRHILHFLAILTLTLLTAALPPKMDAQTKLTRDVVSNGAAEAQNSSFSLLGTIGQSLIGSAKIQQSAGFFGFWYNADNTIVSIEQIPGAAPIDFLVSAPYPNPAAHQVNCVIRLPEAGPVHVMVYDALGRRRDQYEDYSHGKGYHLLSLPLSNLVPGHYLLRIAWNGQIRNVPLTLLR